MVLARSESGTDGDNDEGVISWDAETARLQQVSVYLQLETLHKSTQQIISCRPKQSDTNYSVNVQNERS